MTASYSTSQSSASQAQASALTEQLAAIELESSASTEQLAAIDPQASPQRPASAQGPSSVRPDRPVAIRFSGVKKRYRLGAVGGKTLQEDLQSWWARVRGKDDPNIPLDMDARLQGQHFMALDGIDLTVYQGEAVGIIGANGAGKSTLLKLLAQVTAPTEGEIDVYGRVASMLEVGTGFNGELTGRENAYMNGAILGMTKREVTEVLDGIIEFSEVGEFIDTPVKRYSSGMYIRLAFAVAAHLRSEILVCDEVLAVGDMAFQDKCLTRMREAANAEGRTVLYVSHNMTTIRRLCTRCIVLSEGRIIFDGDVDAAIAIYMKHALSENEVDIDLADKARDSSSRKRVASGQRIAMQRLELMDKSVPVYERGEDMRMRLRVRYDDEVSEGSSSAIENVRVRLSLRSDGDVAVATSWSEPFCLHKGDNEIAATLPLGMVRRGVFYVSIGLYRDTDLGRRRSLDHISLAFRMEVAGVPTWNTESHGYIELPATRIDDLRL